LFSQRIIDTTVSADTTYFDEEIVTTNWTNYYWRVGATNSNGTTWSETWKFSTRWGGGGGCPHVFSDTGKGFVDDNNILPSSSFAGNEGRDVRDRYILRLSPAPSNGTYRLEIREFENERSRLDRFELVALDHQRSTHVGLLHSGDVFEYTTPFHMVDDKAEKKGVKEILSTSDGRALSMDMGDSLGLDFVLPSSEVNEDEVQAGIVLGGWSGNRTGTNKPPKEAIVGTIGEDSASGFRFRENLTLVFVPLKQLTGHVVLRFAQPAMLDYVNLYVTQQSSFQSHTLAFLDAKHSRDGSVWRSLVKSDKNYATLNPGESISLLFKTQEIPKGLVRDFLLISEGRYERISVASKEEGPTLPTAFRLAQNYPNPFNPATTIKYDLPVASHVVLRVYDLLGRDVITLVNGVVDAGYHEVVINTSNLASGVYLYRMEAGSFIETRKMILLR
jgi:hypothetical protein